MRISNLLAILMAAISAPVIAQHTVVIKVGGRPDFLKSEDFFITGRFQKWQPGEDKWQVKINSDGDHVIVIKDVKSGLLEYKFTRGNWKTLESTADGRLVAPRSAIITKDTVIEARIEGWRDHFPASTASAQVQVLDTAMYIPQLKRTRTVRIYLPKDYKTSKRKYPVLYMHDGQDLFDEATSEGRIGPLEWGVDETIDAAGKGCIVVATDHHADKKMRIKEYYTNANSENKGVEGKAYLEFIVKTLKPLIDKQYRTIPDKKHTAMAGSSMGGLLTFYAGLYYPDVFGSLGVLSPSVWLDERNIYRELEQLKSDSQIHNQRYYFYAGGNENRMKPDSSFVRMHDDVKATSDILKEKVNPDLQIAINPSGRHGAWYWRMAFPAFYKWLSEGWEEK